MTSIENIEFLGSSQTFTGVLCTLVVLCMMLEKSNFIHNILLNIGKEIKSLIRRSANFKAQEIIETDEYKEFLTYKAQLSEKDPNAPLNGEAYILNQKILSRFNTSVSNQLSDITISTNHFIDLEQRSKEQVLGPYISFSFCIFLFILDEVCSLGWMNVTSASTFLFYTWILCFLLLLSNWFFYGRRVFRRLRDIENGNSKVSIRVHSGKIKFSPDILMIIEIVIALTILYLYSGTAVLALRSPEFRSYADLFLSFIAVLWPMAVVSYHHRIHFSRFISYSDMYPISHFIFILLTTALIIGGVFLTNYIWNFDLRLFIPDRKTMIFLSEMLVLIFGLCLPLVFPYISFQRAHDIATDRAMSIKKDYRDNLKKQIKELRKFNTKAYYWIESKTNK